MRYIGFIFALCLSIQAIASNTITLSSVSGTPQTEVEVVVSLDNTDAITALELNIPLGEHLSYVDGSTLLASSRSNGHLLTATQVQQELRICVYSLNLSALQGNSGELLSFRLKLGNEPATYTLTPSVILSDARGQSLDSDVQSGQVSILAPKLEILNPQIDYGHIPIRETYTQDLQLYNAGNLPLIIEDIVVNDPAFTPAQTALTIEVGEVAYTTIHYAPTVRGAIQKEVVVTSNAINGKQMGIIVADPFSVNELHVVGGSGIADNAVTISLKMNNMEPIVGMQCTFVLPEQLEYIAGSLSASSSRSNGHQALASVKKFVEKENQWYDSKGDTLVLMLYSMANQPLNGNDGEIATFQVRLNGNSGSYALTPRNVVLTNATAENMVSATSEGWVEIQSPQFSGDDYLSFGDWSITDDIVANYVVRNYGDASLEIERVTFLAQGYRVVSTMPLQINPWEESTMQIAYDPAAEGDFSTTMNIYTNDPTTRMKAVAVSGHVYEPNTLSVDGERMQDGSYQLAISLDNYTNIVGVQYDIHWRSDMTTSQAAFTPTARLQNHTYAIMPIGQNTYRVLIYSLSNTPITGKDGELHQLLFTPQGDVDYCGDVLTIDNIVLSNANGTDKVSQSTVLYHLPTTQYSEQTITACDQYVYNNKVYQSSGTYIDTLQTVGGCDSIVTTYLTINHSEREEYRLTTCKQYEWHGQIYTETGDYEYHTTTEHGCERVEVLHLTISDREQEEFYETACEEYYWNGQTYTESGDYTFNTTSSSGCDRTEVLHLTIYKRDTVHYYETACNEYYWDHNWQYYYDSGDYEYYTTNEHGCERVEILHLTIHHSEREEYYVTTCNQYEWNGQVYTEPGDYEYYTTTEYGCERVEVLHLSFSDREYEEYYETACDQYEWHGEVYTESGDYTFNTISSSGCERTEVLHLTIFYSEHEEYNVTACDSYEWHGETYTESGDYEYRTTITHVAEKLYVGYNAQNDPIIGLTPPRGISRFTVDGFITEGSGACFVGTGTPVDEEADNSDLRIFDAGCFYYDRMSGRNACFFYDFREPFNIEFGNYYAKNLETGEYYFNEGNNVYEYSNTEHPLTLFYNDYGKIHKVQFFDNNNLLWADINAVIEGGLPIIKIDYYEADGTIYHTQKFTENLYVERKNDNSISLGCERVEVLHLTISHSEREEYSVTECDQYEWHGEVYTESGTYEYHTTTEQGCERVEVLHLTINRSEREEYSVTACNQYEWHGEVYTESGMYEYHTTTDQGCERVEVLYLTISDREHEEYYETACDEFYWDHNGQTYYESGDYIFNTTAANGCERTEVLHLTINHSEREEYYETACDAYEWHGHYYYESGDYEYYTTTDQGCERVEVLHLTINHSEREEYYETACDEFYWDYNGETYYESGDYEYYTTTDQGCERVEVLHLTIYNSQYEEYWETACDEFWWHDNQYTESGDYEYHTTLENGCQRVEVLHLTINRSEREEYWETACNEYYWDHNGETYYMSGDYEYYTTTDQGCKRVEILHLTINHSEREEYWETACNEYYWDHNGETYYESGDYEYYTTTDQGCERVEVLHLTINHSEHQEYYETACDEYYWDHNGETYYETGDYEYYTTTDQGCERVEVLHLTINNTQYAEETVTACDSYTWNGETYTASGEYTYTTTASNGCDSIVTLYLTINNSEIGAIEYATICYGETYTWNGQTYAATGEYSVTLTNAVGCDSIATLHLTIMPEAVTSTETVVIGSDELPYTWRDNTYLATGRYTDIEQYTQVDCDSAIHVLDLTVLTTGNFDEESITICETETPYMWYGESYTATGKYTYTEKYTGTDIDSVQHILNLTVNPTKYTEETITACDSYTWNGETYITSGEYTYTTTAANGCDSVVTLHLTIHNTQYAEETVVACDSYTWNDETYTESGEYTYNTTAANGCDSVVTLHLTINATKYAEETVTACDSYTWNSETYTESGEYVYTTTAANGCDSIITLHLTINATKYAEETVTACDSYTWNGNTYTASGEYTYTTTAANGCDSIVTLHLIINNTQYAEESVVACDSYTWNGETYTESGEYTYTTTAANGCDSIVTLHLIINNTQYAEETVTACDSYTWNGETYTASGKYTYTTTASNGCDSIVTLYLTINNSEIGAIEYATICYGETYTWNGQTYAATGEYSVTLANAAGCDSIATLHLTIMPEAVTSTETVVIGSDELPYTWRGNTYLATGRYTDIEQYTQVDCDSAIHVLDLTVLTTGNFDEESITICETEAPYIWYSESYTATGKYTYTEKYTGTDIDSVQHILNLTVNPTKYTEETITACDSYTWNGNTYTASGEYTYTTTAANGCDSIITLHLTINATKYTEKTVTACDSYTWNDETYTESGEYTYNTTAANGCDSIVTLHLTINKTQYAEEIVTACDSYAWNGKTYNESGEYTYTTTAANGCDSIVTLHLTINKSEREEYTAVACDEYIWNDVTYTESGDYTYTTTTAAGCERVEVLHLTINKSEHIEETVTACDSYEWKGLVYTESGDYTYTTTTDQGCERVEILHLTINHSEREEYYETACDEYYWDHNGETYYESGDYEYYTTTDQGCERVEVLHLTILPDATAESETLALCPSELPYEWYGQWLTEAGTYSATEQYVGMECDSIIHELTLNVYVQTLPATVTLPNVRTGEAINVTIPTAEIQTHIASETWYAPNAVVVWYIMENSDWAALNAEPVAAGTKQVVLKYAVETDCGNVESENMVIDVIPTGVENTNSPSPISSCQKILYEDHIYILRDGKIYSIMGQEL